MADVQLNPHEARVLGVLIEKELTTPEQYPLSLHAATTGSNQKSNRDPVSDYSEAEVIVALQGLVAKHLAGKVLPAGSRVEKFRHNARETLQLDGPGLAVVAELLMRGPQTPGELRARAARMAPIATLDDLHRQLEQLAGRGYVRRVAPSPGSRAERYGQLLAPEAHPLDAAPAAASAAGASRAPERASLEARVQALEAEVAALRARLDELGA